MKTAAISAVMLGIASAGYSQSINGGMEEVKLSNVDLISTNQDYVEKVYADHMPDHVIELERNASRFNIRESRFFDKRSKDFEISFISKNGELTVTYDRNGKILKTDERFDQVDFPATVRNAIYNAYPKWTIHKGAYLVSYNYKGGVNKIYEAQLRKNIVKTNVKFNAAGERLD